MVKLSDDVAWHIEAMKVMENADPYRVYEYHKMFFDKLSDLQLILINHGYDISLVGGRLLNAYRDMGVIIPSARFFTSFMLWDEFKSDNPPVDKDGSEWERRENLWDLIINFTERDNLMYLKARDNSIPPYPANVNLWVCCVSKVIPGRIGPQCDGFKFSFGVKGFDDFPVHNLDVNRFLSANEFLQQKYPHLRDSIVLSGQGNSFEEDGECCVGRLHYSCDKEWLVNRSQVFLYRSPFWTMDENYIESYLEVRFGSDWNVPVTDEVEWRKQDVLQDQRRM